MRRLNLLVFICLCVGNCLAQKAPAPASSPTPVQPNVPAAQQESVKVFTEEVVLPVRVTDQQGRFDPTLHKDELLILEDRVPQQIMSARQVPANVLLLISTAGELNPAMKANISKEVAAHFVSRLKTGDRVALVQYGRQVHTIQNWTEDLSAAAHAIQTNIVSYAGMGQKTMWKSQPLVEITAYKRKTAADVALEVLKPIGSEWEKPKIRLYVDTDIQMRLRRMEYVKAMKEGDRWLRQFAFETAGTIFVPPSVKEMLVSVEEIARNVDSQYVVTYKPKRSFASGIEGEYRRVELVPRRVGLVVSSRRGYVTPGIPKSQ